MKKLWLLLGVIVLSFALVSCGGDDGPTPPDEKRLIWNLRKLLYRLPKTKKYI